jgi:lactate dehydrogenase-like 2-hydroxyacid dehydrogenase
MSETAGRLRVFVSRRLPERVEHLLGERYQVTLNPADTPVDAATLARAMSEYDAVCITILDRVDRDILHVGGRRAGIIANFGVGVDHIDIEAAREAGIAVTNTPGVLTEATADLALTLMLMVARRAGEGERELRAGRWTGWRPTHLMGEGLSGKTLGLVGFGRIAKATAERAHFGFGMEIAYYARREDASGAAEKLQARFQPDLPQLLQTSDIVSLHVPGGTETRHLIDADMIARMRPSGILINTARGDVIDTSALVAALAGGRIAGAGLDVYEGEPHVAPELIALENVVLLPHLGSATRETREQMGMRVLANLDAWFKGEALPDRVA